MPNVSWIHWCLYIRLCWVTRSNFVRCANMAALTSYFTFKMRPLGHRKYQEILGGGSHALALLASAIALGPQKTDDQNSLFIAQAWTLKQHLLSTGTRASCLRHINSCRHGSPRERERERPSERPVFFSIARCLTSCLHMGSIPKSKSRPNLLLRKCVNFAWRQNLGPT